MEVDSAAARHTLYVNNLHEKIPQDDLKKAMRAMFGQFGNVVDVVSRRTYRLRGQAWVVFEKEEDAQQALEAMQGFPFLNKPIRISFAKTTSDAVKKMDGTFREEEVEERKRRKLEAKQLSAAAAAPAEAGRPAAAAAAPSANRLLFAENLPAQANEAMLALVFQQFPGFKEVRMVPQRPGIAFVEYDNEAGAAAALAGLQGFRLATDKPMQLTYAKQ